MGGPALVAAGAAAAWLAWAARGRSAQVFGRSIWRGPAHPRALALTFDDGPSPQTPELAAVLDRFGVPATFFACGMHVRRLPEVARDLARAGHEIGNHTETHARLWMRSRVAIREEVRLAQEAIAEATGRPPALFRAPYGVRWFGLDEVQREFGLTGVMWTVIGRDWVLDPDAVARRILKHACNGAILCLHDGREDAASPSLTNTIGAVRDFVPRLLDAGYEFRTVSALMG